MMNTIKGNKTKYSALGVMVVALVLMAIAPNVVSAQASIQPGTLSYQCLYSPFRIQLDWTSGVNANSNSIEKGDIDPNDPGRFWGFIFQDSSLNTRTYTDTNVQQGVSYSYRVKYAPQVPSNVVVVNCGGGNNPPAQPTVDIKANGSDGPVTIQSGTSATLSWTSTNAASCTVNPGNLTGTSGSQSTGNLTASRTYFITCSDAGNNNSASDQVTVNVQQVAQPTVDIKANGSDGPVTIQSGTSATLSWTSTNAASCTVNPGNLTGTSGSQSTGNLTNSQTYTISCINGSGQAATDSVTVTVQTVQVSPTVDLKVNGQDGAITIQSGTSATLSWTSSNTSYCSISPSNYSGTSGSASTGVLTSSQTYTITCNGTNGSQVTDSVSVNVQTLQVTADIKINGQDGAITIQSGTSATLSWTSTGVTYCSITPINYSGTSGSATTGVLNSTVTYTLNCTGSNGAVATDSVTANVQGTNTQQPTVTLNANPTSVNAGGASTLTWTSTNATSCVASGGWSGTKALSGSEVTYPASTNTYSIVCINSAGQQATAQTTISVNGQNPQNPTVDLKVNGQDGAITIQSGTSATLSWTSSNTSYCSISPSNYSGTSGSASTGVLTSSQNYVLTCNVSGGTQTDSVMVNVQGTNTQQPTVTLNANPTSVNTGQSTTLYWTSTNATSCTVSGNNWSGSRTVSGSDIVTPSQTGTYTITCYGNGGSANAQTTVFVNGINNPTGGNLPTVSLVAIPQGNGNYLLSWVSSNATSCYASGGWSGTKALSGSEVVRPNGTNTYNIICTNGNGSANDARTISTGGQVLGVGDIVTGPENPLPWMLLIGFIGSIGLHVIFFRKKQEDKEVSLDEVLSTLRSTEKAPDTSTLAAS